MPRPPRPDDLYRLRVPIGVRLSPDGRSVVTSLKTVAPGFDGYRHALWMVPTDGGGARQLTIGAKNDWHARWSPDGRTLAFLSDRRTVVEEESEREGSSPREDSVQVYLLPVDGGEARRLTDLPRGVTGLEWSPDGTRLVVVSTSHAATFKEDRKKRGLASGEPGRRRRPTTGSSIGSTTCSTARASPTTGSATCGWSTPRPARPAG